MKTSILMIPIILCTILSLPLFIITIASGGIVNAFQYWQGMIGIFIIISPFLAWGGVSATSKRSFSLRVFVAYLPLLIDAVGLWGANNF